MILYHGSATHFNKIDLDLCRNGGDFGDEFYLSVDATHAMLAGRRKLNNRNLILYLYEFEFFEAGLSGISFTSADGYWLRCVVDNRRGLNICNLDYISGATADAYASAIINRFIPRDFNKADKRTINKVIRLLNTGVFPIQYCIKTELALSHLVFRGLKRIRV